jgi:hypothetical protein
MRVHYAVPKQQPRFTGHTPQPHSACSSEQLLLSYSTVCAAASSAWAPPATCLAFPGSATKATASGQSPQGSHATLACCCCSTVCAAVPGPLLATGPGSTTNFTASGQWAVPQGLLPGRHRPSSHMPHLQPWRHDC